MDPTDVSMPLPEQRAVRAAMWSLAVTAAFPLALVFVWAGPFTLAFLGAPFVFLFWGTGALVVCMLAVFSLFARAWRKAAALAIFPLVSLVAFLNLSLVWGAAIYCGDYIHFWVMRGAYLDEVAHTSRDQGPCLAIFQWGGLVISHAVVYDESDEIFLPPEKQSDAWKKRIAGTELECGVWGNPVGDHFYIVRMGC